MAQRKADHRGHLAGFLKVPVHGARAAAEMRHWAVYSTSARYPGKLIQRRPDGTEVVGTFHNGTFVAEQAS